MKKTFLFPGMALALVLAAQAQTAETPALDETLKWSARIYGESDLMTKKPELLLDDRDKQDGATSLAFETAGQGNPVPWLGLSGSFKPPINMADYESLSVSYKITPKVLEPPNAKQNMVLLLGKVATDDFKQAVQEVYLDGEWHTLEVPIADFKQPSDLAETSEYNGEDANVLGLQMFFTRADEFDVVVKVDNIRLKPKP